MLLSLRWVFVNRHHPHRCHSAQEHIPAHLPGWCRSEVYTCQYIADHFAGMGILRVYTTVSRNMTVGPIQPLGLVSLASTQWPDLHHGSSIHDPLDVVHQDGIPDSSARQQPDSLLVWHACKQLIAKCVYILCISGWQVQLTGYLLELSKQVIRDLPGASQLFECSLVCLVDFQFQLG